MFALFSSLSNKNKTKLNAEIKAQEEKDKKLEEGIKNTISKIKELCNTKTINLDHLTTSSSQLVQQIKQFNKRYEEAEADPVIMANILKSLRDFKKFSDEAPLSDQTRTITGYDKVIESLATATSFTDENDRGMIPRAGN